MFDLKEERQKAGLTQEQLANKVFVIRQTISSIECGLIRPSVETAKRIAGVLGFNWTLFFDEEGEE